MPHPRTRRVLFAATAAAACSLLPHAALATSGNQILLQTGTPLGNTDLTLISSSFPNASGQIAFSGAAGPTQINGQFRLDPNGSVTTLALAGQTAPGAAGGTFTNFNGPFLAASSAYTDFYAGISGSPSSSGMFRADPAGNLSVIARVNDPAPGAAGGTFNAFNYESISPTGPVTIEASLVNTTSTYGLFLYNGSLSSIARTGDAAPVPGAYAFTTIFGPAPVNAAGLIAFNASTSSPTSPAGVFRYYNGSLSYAAYTGLAAPGGGTFNSSFGNPSVNANNSIAFTAGTSTTTGVFRADGSGPFALAALARAGDSIPSGGGTFTSFGTPALNSAGQAAFWAGTSISGTTGIYRSAAQGAVTEIIRTGWYTGDGSYSSFNPNVAINSAGAVAFTSNLTGTSRGAANDFGLFLGDGTDHITVAREGDALLGSNITAINFNNTFDPNSSAIDDFGRVTYSVTLANGYSALVRYTPQLNWRTTAASGSWDNANNWTLGLTPASVHDLLIQPTFTTLITGPSANTSVNSLSLYDGSSGPYTLRLDAGGNLTATSYIQVGYGVRVELNAGTLSTNTLQLFATDASLNVSPAASLVVSHFYHQSGTYTGPLTISPAGVTDYELSGGYLNPSSLTLGPGGTLSVSDPGYLSTPTFTQTGGTFTHSGTFYLGGGYAYSISGGSASLNTLVLNPTGSITQTGGSLSIANLNFAGGTFTGNLTNSGTLTYSAGTLAGRLVNQGTLTLSADFAPTNGIENDTDLTLPAGRIVTSLGSGILNYSTLTLAGTVTGSAPLTNVYAGLLSAKGTLSPLLVNQGSLSLTGLLTAFGGFTNTGSISLAPTNNLRIGSSSLNAGRIFLSGGALSATGAPTLTNNAAGLIEGTGSLALPVANTGGLIHATGPLTLTNLTTNSQGGELRIDDNASLSVSTSFSNSGTITLKGPSSLLTGTTSITNTGTIQGAGRISNPVTNTTGRIQADGPLTLSGSGLTNSSLATLKLSSPAASLTLTQGLLVNAGNLSNLGGSFSNNNFPLSNTGTISGFGNFAAGSWTNNNLITLTGGTTTVDGPLTNNAAKTVQLTNAAVTFTSPLTNNGIVKLTNATAVFAGGLTGTPPSSPTGLDPSSSSSSFILQPSSFSPPPGSLTLDPTSAALTSYVSQDSLTNSGSLTLRPTSDGGGPSTLNTLSLTAGSSFDLADDPLTLLSTPADTLRQYLLSRELFSSFSDPTHTLGYLDLNSRDSTSHGLLVQLTLEGDANLDGTLDADDYALLDAGFSTGASTWWKGDFNYDGIINSQDYLLIDSTYLQTHPSAAPTLLAQRDAQFGPDYVSTLLAAVPEPVCPVACLIATLPLVRRRKA